MNIYFDSVPQKDMVGLFIDDQKLCNLIEFDYKTLPPQIAVALQQVYAQGVEDTVKIIEAVAAIQEEMKNVQNSN